jgi:hypothetical protein
LCKACELSVKNSAIHFRIWRQNVEDKENFVVDERTDIRFAVVFDSHVQVSFQHPLLWLQRGLGKAGCLNNDIQAILPPEIGDTMTQNNPNQSGQQTQQTEPKARTRRPRGAGGARGSLRTLLSELTTRPAPRARVDSQRVG